MAAFSRNRPQDEAFSEREKKQAKGGNSYETSHDHCCIGPRHLERRRVRSDLTGGPEHEPENAAKPRSDQPVRSVFGFESCRWRGADLSSGDG
jgi:hypothetical protein